MKKGIENAITERQGIKNIRRYAPRRPYDIEIELNLEHNNVEYLYRFEIKSIKPEADYYLSYTIKREYCEFRSSAAEDKFEIKNGKWTNYPKSIPGGRGTEPPPGLPQPDSRKLHLPLINLAPFNKLYFFLSQMSFYNIYPNEIRQPREPLIDYPLDWQGKNIASVIKMMQRDSKQSLIYIKNALTDIIPYIKDIEVKHIAGYLTLKFYHKYNDKDIVFEASQESDGTLRILGLLVALFQEPSPSLLAIEEPELTVHPGILPFLGDLIKEAAAKRSQVIITTHSPDLITRFDPLNLRIVEWNYQDGTIINKIDENQISIIQEKLFGAGDLLRIEGLRAAK